MPVDEATPSRIWDPASIHDIQEKARLGRYRIRAFSTARQLPTLEDLTFLPAGLTRVPLEGYRETCDTSVTLGTRYAKKPLQLKTPITIAGMSYGALSRNAKEALGLGATRVGTSTCTGDGGMHPPTASIPKRWSISACLRAMGSTRATCSGQTPLRSWSARARNPAPAGCCSARRSLRRSPGCATCRTA